MFEVTAIQRKNTLSAKEMWRSIPEGNVSDGLRSWRSSPELEDSKPTCNTVACFGGWCAWWPPFQEQGMTAGFAGGPVLNGDDSMYNTSSVLFGISDMFVNRGYSTYDDETAPEDSDWAVVMNRIQQVLDNGFIKG